MDLLHSKVSLAWWTNRARCPKGMSYLWKSSGRSKVMARTLSKPSNFSLSQYFLTELGADAQNQSHRWSTGAEVATAGPSRVSGGCDTGCCLACANDVTTTNKKSASYMPKQLSRETGPATRSLGAGSEGELRGNCKLPTVCQKFWAQASHHAKKAIVRGRGMCHTGISIVNPSSKCSNPSQIHRQAPKYPPL